MIDAIGKGKLKMIIHLPVLLLGLIRAFVAFANGFCLFFLSVFSRLVGLCVENIVDTLAQQSLRNQCLFVFLKKNRIKTFLLMDCPYT